MTSKWYQQTRCSCDAFADDPCPVHARENALQEEVLVLRADRDEWRQQHENLLAIYQAEVAERDRVNAALNNALSGESDAVHRAESAEMGCNIAYRRWPTQEEGDACEHRHDQSMGASHGSGECFVPMGSHHGWKCKCGTWVWGGPTVCQRCVDADAVKIAMEWKAEATRLRKLFDDAGQGEHNVLALIDHYQRNSMEADERLRVVRRLLEENGCDCPCDHHADERGADCDVCLACRIGEAVGK